MSAFAPHSPPSTPLGKLRVLSPHAGVRVSPLALGAMNFGEAWTDIMGTMSKETAFDIMDYFYKSGGNFIDTANNYQNEESELWIGEWMAKSQNRDQMFIATKYTTGYNTYDKSINIHVNYAGNHTKSMKLSVDSSLKKLQTDYIDLLYVHWWDHTTSIEEMMQSLNQLVAAGKVLYLGISDTPAWIVSKANQYARDHGLRGFSVYQGMYNASIRDMEREIFPMCKAEGLAVCPWAAVGGGKFKSEKQRKAMEESGEKGRVGFRGGPSEDDIAVTKVLEKIGDAKGKSITAVALAFVLQLQPYVFPMVGGRKIEQLKDNIDALTIELTEDELKEIKGATQFSIGFPLNFIGEKPGEMFLMAVAGAMDFVEEPKAIRPSTE